MSVWLVTGGSGFVGRHVLAGLQARGIGAVAAGRTCPPGWDRARFVACDLEGAASTAAMFGTVRPSRVIHAAGRTPPATAEEYYRANTLGTLNLLEAARGAGDGARVVLVGSAAELGPVDVADLPVGEDHPCHPADSYGLSKLLATRAGLASWPGLQVICARLFNPIGPGTPVTQAFGRFAARLAGGDPSPLTVGDLHSRRDFIDIRDVAEALILLAESGQAGKVYHVGTGASRTVGEGLARLILRCGKKVEVRVDPTLISPEAPRDSRADARRLARQTGWVPRFSFEQSLDDLWDEAAAGSRLPLTV